MDWKDIKSLLLRIENKLNSELMLRSAVLDSLRENVNVDFSVEDIEIKNGVVAVKAHPAVKNEIVLKKTKILDSIVKKVGGKITDLR